MDGKAVYLITGGYGSGKTYLANEVVKSLLPQASSLSVVIFDFVSRTSDILKFPQSIQDSVIIEPVGCSGCNDIESYTQSIVNRTSKVLVVEIPADRINISGLAKALSSLGCAVHVLSVLQIGQNLTPFEKSNIEAAGKMIDRSQDAIYVNLLGNSFKELDNQSENTDRNHVAGGLMKPCINTLELNSFFEEHVDNITRLKGQFYDNINKVWYDIEYAKGWNSIQFKECERMDYRSHSIAITSRNKAIRSSFNKQFMLPSKEGYVKHDSITRDISLVYDVLLGNIEFSPLWNSIQVAFTEEHMFYGRLFRREFDEYTKDIIDENQKLEYTKSLLFYRANQIKQRGEDFIVDADKYLVLSIIMYALDSGSNKKLYITDDIKKEVLDSMGFDNLKNIVDRLVNNIPESYDEEKPYEYRPSVITDYPRILSLYE